MHDFIAFILLGLLLFAPAASSAQGSPKIEKVSYKGWPNCYRVTNGQIELILTSDVGPRVIRFGFVGGDNEFKEYPDQLGKTGGDEWRMYGGHRIWHAPEAQPRTYAPDNSPIEITVTGDRILAVQPVESTTGIQKEMEIRMLATSPGVELKHRLRNRNLWAVEFAPWVLTVMAQGGHVIVPLPPRGSHPENLLPVNPLAMWAYTDLSDRRWKLGNKYISLRQDSQATTPQKVGIGVPDGWAAYHRNGNLFVKRFDYMKDKQYPDYGSSLETFTNAEFIELETLGPMTRLEPGAVVEHNERWFLYKGVKLDNLDDSTIDRLVLPLVQKSH